MSPITTPATNSTDNKTSNTNDVTKKDAVETGDNKPGNILTSAESDKKKAQEVETAVVKMPDKEKAVFVKAIEKSSGKNMNKFLEIIAEFFEKLNIKLGGFEKDAEDKDHKSTTNDKKDISKSNISEKSEKWGNSILGNAKQFLGITEGKDDELIRKFHKAAGLNAGSKSHWCASFVSYVLKQSGVSVPGSPRSKAWLNQGETISKKDVKAGDVIIFDRGSNPANGHIGFATGKWQNGYPVIIAGNTGDAVKEYPEKNPIVGYRRFAA